MRKFLISIFLFLIGTISGVLLYAFLLQRAPSAGSSGHHQGLYKDILPELAKDANSPIKYDAEVQEYQLVYETNENNKKIAHSFPLYYSPFTGERLISGRDKLFSKASPSEIRRISKKVEGAKTLEEVEGILGKPDHVVNASTLRAGIKTQYTYSNLSDSTVLVVQLHDNGLLSFYYTGQRKGDTSH